MGSHLGVGQSGGVFLGGGPMKEVWIQIYSSHIKSSFFGEFFLGKN
jgi:hypothetical protein